MEKKSAKQEAGMSTQGKVVMGASLAALGAAAAGAIFLYGTEAGKKKRKAIKGWSLKMKADVLDKMENMKDWSEEAYIALVDQVAQKYQNIKNVDPEEVLALVGSLKGYWKTIQKHTAPKKKAKKSSKPKAKTSPKISATEAKTA